MLTPDKFNKFNAELDRTANPFVSIFKAFGRLAIVVISPPLMISALILLLMDFEIYFRGKTIVDGVHSLKEYLLLNLVWIWILMLPFFLFIGLIRWIIIGNWKWQCPLKVV